MNEDFAIEPTAFRDARDLKYVLEQFGFSQGRFLAAFPGKWLKLLYEQIESFPDVEKKKATFLLNKYRDDRIVRLGLEYGPNRSWCDNAVEQVQKGLLADAFIATGQQESRLKSIEDMSDALLGDHRSILVHAKASEYQKAATRLIEKSTEIRLVDPYFDVTRPNRLKVLKAFLSIAVSCDCSSIVVFARHSVCQDSRSAEVLRSGLKQYESAGVSVNIHLVNDDCSPHKMHARYLLSIKGGLQFDKGFVEEITQQFVTIDALSDGMVDLLYGLYWDATHGFETIETISWP